MKRAFEGPRAPDEPPPVSLRSAAQSSSAAQGSDSWQEAYPTYPRRGWVLDLAARLGTMVGAMTAEFEFRVVDEAVAAFRQNLIKARVDELRLLRDMEAGHAR